MQRAAPRGIVLIITLVILTVLVMFVGATIALEPSWLNSESLARTRASAQAAADSGLEYARCRLREDSSWNGDGNAVMVNSPELKVVEDKGNVIGLIRQKDGQVSQFRIRFNFYDGNAGADSLDDPASHNLIDSPYVSVNNLLSTAATVVPAGDGPGHKVTSPTTGEFLAERSACIQVEGRAGDGLRDLSADPNAPPTGPVSSVCVAAQYTSTPRQVVNDAAVMAGGDQDYRVANGHMVNVTSARRGSTSLRTKGLINVHDVNDAGDDQPGLLKVGDARLGTRDGVASDLSGAVVRGHPTFYKDVQDFYNIKWDDVHKADSAPATREAMHIPAGVYVHWGVQGELHYYNMPIDEYKSMIHDHPDNPGVAVHSDNLSEIRIAEYGVDPANVDRAGDHLSVVKGTWKIKKDTFVVPTGETTEFVVIPRRGFKSEPDDHSMDLEVGNPTIASDPARLQGLKFVLGNVTLSVPGSAIVAASINSTSSTITAGDNLTVNSHTFDLKHLGVLELGEEKGLNLYAKGPVTVSTYHDEDNTGVFGPIRLTGLFYSQKQVQFKAGAPGTDIRKWSGVNLRGCLVAYGADPSTETPGPEGDVTVCASQIRLRWDPRVLGALVSPSSPLLTLERVSYAVR